MTGVPAARMLADVLAEIPSPTQGVWHLGFLPIRAYALCIIVGIVVAVWWGERRYRARGGGEGAIYDISFWAVAFGIVGGRIYHVITSPQAYFGRGGVPIHALYIWQGGLGIWGAISLGGVGAWIGCKRAGILLPPVADALAPGIVAAQAIGRWGNWFNNELYGRATSLPWRLKIYDWGNGQALLDASGQPIVKGYFHPTFLYESLWCAGVAVLIVWADRRFRMGHGRVFALYVVAYSAGRLWIEALRVDQANHILGLRLNIWTSILAMAGGLIYLVLSHRRRPGREVELRRPDAIAAAERAQQQASPDPA